LICAIAKQSAHVAKPLFLYEYYQNILNVIYEIILNILTHYAIIKK